MVKLLDEVKTLKDQYLSQGLTDDEAIAQIAKDLGLSVLFVKVLYYLV